MSVTTNDVRAKAVYTQLIDKVSTMYPLSNLLTDMGTAMQRGESIDIPTRDTAATIEAATTGSTINQLTIQSQAATANNLVVDRHYGSAIRVGKIQDIFDLEGTWSGQLAEQIRTELGDYMDQDCYDALCLEAAYDTSATYWVNAAGATLTGDHVRLAMAKMLSQKGVRKENCVWVFDVYGSASLSNVTEFKSATGFLGTGNPGAFGTPTVGTLFDIPVVESQSVRSRRSIACTAVSISSNVATVTVASGHGLVPGMKITISGITTPLSTAATITAVSATTLTVPLTASDGAMADGAGTVTCDLAMNGLVCRNRAFVRKQQMPDLRIVPESDRISDVLQFDAIWGRKALAGSFIGLGSPRQALTG